MFRMCALTRSRRLSRTLCLLLCAVFAVGCANSDPAEMERLYREWSEAVGADDSWILAPDAEELPVAEQSNTAEHPLVAETCELSPAEPVTNVRRYWGCSADTKLVRLPCVDEADSAELIETELQSPDSSPARPDTTAVVEPKPAVEAVAEAPSATLPELEVPMPEPEPVVARDAQASSRSIELPQFDDLSPEERHLLELITRESLGATTGTLTDRQLDEECRIKISAAYALSQRGAAYAAREELIGVLRLISQAKDARDATRSRTESLAAGLRALEEAEDFVPRGSQLEAEMKLDVVCAAHRTPLARELNLTATLPSKMMERYHRYAQIKLAVAVAGEPAGSMALYSLGKVNSLLGATENEHHPLAAREAMAFQQAALLAHNENYMAAHELGVLLAETGHFREAQHMLIQVAAEQPNAVVFRNLARVQEALGNRADAQLCRTEATRLAGQGRGPKPNVSWVSPQEFSRDQMNNFTPQIASRSAAPIQSAPPTVWR